MSDISVAPLGITDTWNLSNRVNLRLLDALSDEQLGAVIQPRGKPVMSYFTHIHMARFYWLGRRAPALAKRLRKIRADSTDRASLRQALFDSGEAMAALFSEAERTGQIRAARLGPLAFLSYALAHEAHHRGQILLHLKIAKLPVSRAVADRLWSWNRI